MQVFTEKVQALPHLSSFPLWQPCEIFRLCRKRQNDLEISSPGRLSETVKQKYLTTKTAVSAADPVTGSVSSPVCFHGSTLFHRLRGSRRLHNTLNINGGIRALSQRLPFLHPLWALRFFWIIRNICDDITGLQFQHCTNALQIYKRNRFSFAQ